MHLCNGGVQALLTEKWSRISGWGYQVKQKIITHFCSKALPAVSVDKSGHRSAFILDDYVLSMNG